MLTAEDFQIIAQCDVFRDVESRELPDALRFLDAYDRAYQKGEMIFLIGEPVRHAGIMLNGAAELSFLDESDNSVNMNHFAKGAIFGESLACSGENKSPVQMEALTDCRILFLRFENVLNAKRLDSGYQARIASNLLLDFARQNVFLNRKIRILSQKKLRDRMKVFLRSQDIAYDGTVRIAFNRNELARFLGVNRSALSRELSLMRKEGLLSLNGKSLRLLDKSFLFGESSEF
ncbi:MAG: Crp/Fnr family transcriptional regulator [Oscillibacter sp.]|nr:Crp/Fnr family transcriptional regulator [Oscillibacter sp.]